MNITNVTSIRPIKGADGIVVWVDKNGCNEAHVFVRCKEQKDKYEQDEFILFGVARNFPGLISLENKARELDWTKGEIQIGTDKESDYEENCVCCGKSLNGAACEVDVCQACTVEAVEFNSDIAKGR